VLDAAGLIALAETRRVRGVEERRYARMPGPFKVDEEALSASGHAAAIPDINVMPLRQALAEARIGGVKDDEATTAQVVRARMPAHRAQRFARLLNELSAEFIDGPSGTGEMFGLITALYRPDWASKEAKSRRRVRAPRRSTSPK
jgi:hypothetical protein